MLSYSTRSLLTLSWFSPVSPTPQTVPAPLECGQLVRAETLAAGDVLDYSFFAEFGDVVRIVLEQGDGFRWDPRMRKMYSILKKLT